MLDSGIPSNFKELIVFVLCMYDGRGWQWRMKKKSKIWGEHKYVHNLWCIHWILCTYVMLTHPSDSVIIDFKSLKMAVEQQNIFFWLWSQLTWVPYPPKCVCCPCHFYSQSTSVSSSMRGWAILFYMPFL